MRKLLAAHDSKELRRGVEALKKRVDKHFGDADDPGLSRNLVLKVLKACEGAYVDCLDRVEAIKQSVYVGGEDEKGTLDWWKAEEVAAAFRR